MAGRPTDCTPETIEAVAEGIRGMLTVRLACLKAGIAVSSYHLWMARGVDGERPYSDFLEAITRAEHDGAAAMVTDIAADPDWRAKAWLLERRHREDYGRIDRTEITGAKGGPVQMATIDPERVQQMTDEELAALRSALTRLQG